MVDDPNRTVHAQQAFEFGDVFVYKFQGLVFGQQKPRRLKLNQPDGMSTQGGRQARQPMVLTAEDGENLVCGWVDVPAHASEIRSYEAMASQFQARHGRPVDLEKAEYDRLLQELEGFLKIQKIEIKIAASAPVPQPRQPAAPVVEKSSEPGDQTLPLALGMLVLGMILGFGLGYVAFGM